MSVGAAHGPQPALSWLAIVRLGLVQTALGAIVVLATATLNRVMVVELQLPATLPGVLVAFHYFVQLLRPRWGHGSDGGQRRTPWIIGGMTVLAAGAVLAAFATAEMAVNVTLGVSLAVLAYLLIGVGVGAAGTSLLVLVAKTVAAERRGPAASIMWMMMIAGFVITSAVAGRFLDPFSPRRLLVVCTCAALAALLLAILAVWRVEAATTPYIKRVDTTRPQAKLSFAEALRLVWSEQASRRFTLFIFISMLAYSAQDLILEPFAGIVFGFTLGQSTKLAGLQNGGVLTGMVLVALVGNVRGLQPLRLPLRSWTVGGCLASAAALLLIVLSGSLQWTDLFRVSVFGLGLGNGVFAVAAIGSMMEQAGAGHRDREGVRVGLWGAAQAIAFALGGLFGAAGVDVARGFAAAPLVSYAAVFMVEALLFLFAARLALVTSERSKPTVVRAPPQRYAHGVEP